MKLFLIFLITGLKTHANNINEGFFDFFQHFRTNTTFQLERTLFPLQHIELEPGIGYDTTYVEKDDWSHKQFWNIYTSKCSLNYIPQIYDNFELKLQDTNERVFAWHGIDCGIQVLYYFKRINHKWYLIKMANLST